MFHYTVFTRTDLIVIGAALIAVLLFGSLYFVFEAKKNDRLRILCIPAFVFFFTFFATKTALHFITVQGLIMLVSACILIGFIILGIHCWRKFLSH